MELTCAFLVVLAGLVAGSPSGYGVKGGAGAVAKAEANSAAFAGAGTAPGSIPFPTTGTTVSGSYSKSSASNFAASASSAHSSSFSYSGSGVIPPGIGVPENTKCQTGTCSSENDGGKPSLVSGTPGNNVPAHSGANAISAAGATSYAGSQEHPKNGNTPCTGDCQKTNCQGSDCDVSNNAQTCTYGSCGSGPATSTPEHELDDIVVNTAGSHAKNSYGDDTQTSGSTPYHSGSGCSKGKCDKNLAPDQYPSAAEPTNKPSIHLTTPKQEPPCSSPNCGSPKENIYDKNRPSSYNVPILGTDDAPSRPDNCATGNCQEVPSKSSPSSLPSSPHVANPPVLSPGPGCSSPDCGASSTSFNVGPAVPKYPSHSPPNQPYDSVSAISGANANSMTYNGPKTSQNVPFIPLATNKKSLPYTGGFGGPPGILKPNDFNVPSKIPTPGYKPTYPINPIPSTANNSPCSTGNCGQQPSYPTSQYPTSGSPTVGQYKPASPGPYNPSSCTSGNCGKYPGQALPQHEQSSLASQNQFKPPVPPAQPSPSQCAYGNCKTPVSNPPQYTPNSDLKPIPSSPCASGNCGPSSQNTPISSSSYPSGGSYKPSGPLAPYNPSPCGSGNCETPSHSKPQYTPSNSPNGGSYYKPATPTETYKPGPCSSGNCGTYPEQPEQPSKSPYSPAYSSVCTNGNCGQSPSYPSLQGPHIVPQYKPSAPVTGFGAPAGILKPNDYSAPSVPTTVNFKPTGSTGSFNPATFPCSSGSCSSQSQSLSQYNPGPTPGFGAPAGILKPNDYNAPSSIPATEPAGSYKPGTASCSSGGCGSQPSPSSPQYNLPGYKPIAPATGFGGPAGILKPNDHTAPSSVPISNYKPSGPTGSYNPAGTGPCSSGTCSSQPGQSYPPYNPSPAYKPTAPPAFGAPAGILKPNDHNAPSSISTTESVGSYNPTTAPCLTGSCGPQPGQSSPQYNPSHSYKPTAPAPGFGAPPGILKPSDNSGSSSFPSAGAAGPQYPAPCSTGNCGSQPDQSSPQYNPLPAYKPTAPATGLGGSPNIKPSDYTDSSSIPSSGPTGPYNPIICSTGSCGPQPGQSSPQYNQIPAYKPTAPVTGSGASAGIFKPNDYSTSSSVPSTGPTGSFNPTPCSSGICGSQPSPSSPQYYPNNSPGYKPTTGFGGPAGILKPNDYNTPTNVPASNFKPAGSYIHGNAPNGPAIASSGSASSYHPSSCTSGNCGAQPYHNKQSGAAGAYSAAGAVASAKAVAYTGGFGGPPGLLKPYDGKAGSNAAAYGSLSGAQGDSRGFYGKSIEGAGPGSSSASGAQSSAIAGASAGAYGGQGDKNGKQPGGCTDGCGSSDGLAVAGAAAKSVATAGAGSYAGSFASSSASAHASAGAATKGGYGR